MSDRDYTDDKGKQLSSHLFQRRTLSGRHFSMSNFQDLRNALKKEKDLEKMNSVVARSVSRVN